MWYLVTTKKAAGLPWPPALCYDRSMDSRYDTDLLVWSEEQARALRAAAHEGSDAPIDWEHVAEEIESLGAAERRALASHIGTVIEHLLKLQASPATAPERGWRDSIRRARRDIERLLAASPSLRREVGHMIDDETIAARSLVLASLADYDERPLIDIAGATYSEEQVLGEWMPERR
jgi:Domain of unknown function DUF29